ncbi:conserved hypothetical protein [Ricinus communis]|uniref:Reverse transcriptase zinc-binding domain-containing protein n=1 Tax=Ricinus communis TaxID=3988 RepID=B9S0C1_RICCO|nr:conserved hypothetical protein [Ricinus communis]
MSVAIKPVLAHMIQCKVTDLAVSHSGWRWGMFHGYLPSYVLMRIAAVCSLNSELRNDVISWGFSRRGIFSTKSAYAKLTENNWGIVNGA